MSRAPIPASTFEGLYVRALKPSGELLRELTAAGFNPGRMEPTYPPELWERCIEIARRHTFPGLAREEADERLGRRFNQGFFETLLGSLIKVSIPIVGFNGVVSRLPRTAPTAFPGIQVAVSPRAAGGFTVELWNSPVSGAFARGVLLDSVEAVGWKVQVETEHDHLEPGVGHRCRFSVQKVEGP